MKKFVLVLLLAVSLSPAVSFAQVVVGGVPPRVIVERRGPMPGCGYVWVPGYQRWDGRRYIWVSGHWDRPPRPGVAGVRPR